MPIRDHYDRLVRRRSKARPCRRLCRRCGRFGWYKPRQAHCRYTTGMLGSYYCDGALSRQEMPVPKREVRPQDVAAKRLAFSRKMVAKKSQALRRTATSLRFWEERCAYYAKRASMTDAEVEAERERRKTRPVRVKRGLRMEGEL